MKTAILVFLLAASSLYSQIQSPELTGNSKVYRTVDGKVQVRSLTGNTEHSVTSIPYIGEPQSYSISSSTVRWIFTDAIAIGDITVTSGNGQHEVTGWGLNVERISLYGNASNAPVWEYSSNPNVFINYVSISDTGGVIGGGSYHNVLMFNRSSPTPFFDFNLETQVADTGIAGPMDITNNGNFIVACASRNDSSWIFGFNSSSTNWVWRHRVGQMGGAGGAGIMGINISGNDSVTVVNTYGGFYVFRTYTGQLLFSGLINPTSTSGTQAPCAISGNGNIVATINYSGFVRVHQWNGSTYNLLWQHQEPPGAFFNWMTAVDVSNDGSMVACGTLQFVTSNSFDGKVKLFRTTNGSTPIWTYTGCGDEVSSVSFSKDGKILAAASWGDLNNLNNDLLVFKTSVPTASPIFAVNTPGSFFSCDASANGSTIMASGKKVHARAFGNGGETYNIFIDTNDTPLGISNNSAPVSFSLKQNYPNPFNPSTQINYDIMSDANAKIIIYDMLGREVKTLVNKFHKSGRYSVILNAGELTSGVYFYKLVAEDFTDTKKLVLVK
jgi:hypothetical protein